MSSGDEASGTGAKPTLTKPSGSTRATFYMLTQHALSYLYLRRFPEALRKLDQVLNITPDDVDTLVTKASYRTSRRRPATGSCATRSAASGRRRHSALWKHKFTKRSWSAALRRRFLG